MPFRVLIYDNSEVAFNKHLAVENTECKASVRYHRGKWPKTPLAPLRLTATTHSLLNYAAKYRSLIEQDIKMFIVYVLQFGSNQ